MCGNLRKTKIICTIGPASCDKDVLRELMKSGMDVARFNFSHGEYETFEKWLKNVEEVREELGLPVATQRVRKSGSAPLKIQRVLFLKRVKPLP